MKSFESCYLDRWDENYEKIDFIGKKASSNKNNIWSSILNSTFKFFKQKINKNVCCLVLDLKKKN